MDRAVAYGRVSTTGQAEHGYSLDAQREAAAAWCQARGYALIEHVEDAGESGKLSDRSGLLRIRELVAARVVDVVVFPVLDRISRTNWRIQRELEEIRSLGVRVEFVGQPNVEGLSGRLLENVQGAIAEHEYELIRERTMKGRAAKARGGHFPGNFGRNGSPFGYRMVSVAESLALPEFAGRSGELLIDETEAETVRRIFTLYREGHSHRGIAQTLNAAGLRTRLGALWSSTTLRRMLGNPLYIGQARWGAQEYHRIDARYTTGTQRSTRTPRTEPTAVIPVPPIVSPADFAVARLRLAERTPRGPASPWLLRGVLRCGTCVDARGRHLALCGLQKAPTRSYYRCNSVTAQGRPFCGLSVRAEPLERDLTALLDSLLVPGALAREADRKAAAQRKQLFGIPEELRKVEKGLAEVEGKLVRLADSAIAGLLPADLLAGKAAELGRERERLQDRARVLAAVSARQDRATVHTAAEAAAAELRALLERRTPEHVNQALRRLLRVYLRRGEAPAVEILLPVA